MYVTFDEFYFGEYGKDKFLEALEYSGINPNKGKVIVKKGEAQSLLIISAYPGSVEGGCLFAKGFDTVTVYSEYRSLSSDNCSYLKFTEGETERYFCVADEPRQIYFGSNDDKKILRALKKHHEEWDCYSEAFIEYIRNEISKYSPDLVGIVFSV